MFLLPTDRVGTILPHSTCPSVGCFHEAGYLHRCRIFPGSNLRSTSPITKGWCSPALPTSGPRIFISQPSFSRDPTIDTRRLPAGRSEVCDGEGGGRTRYRIGAYTGPSRASITRKIPHDLRTEPKIWLTAFARCERTRSSLPRKSPRPATTSERRPKRER